jgi:hypothetical protein
MTDLANRRLTKLSPRTIWKSLTNRRSLLDCNRSDGVVAQLVEHHNGIVGVRGSSPLGSTILRIVSV